MTREVDQDLLLSTDDATVWAEEFCRALDGHTVLAHTVASAGPHSHPIVTEGTMIAWFAGAIETAKILDRKRRRKPRPQYRHPTHDP